MGNNKHLYFLGAGSTAFLGTPTTKKQEDAIKNAVFKNIGNVNEDLKSFIVLFFDYESFDLLQCFNCIDYLLEENRNFQDFDNNKLVAIRKELVLFITNLFDEAIKNRDCLKIKSITNFYYGLAKREMDKIKNEGKGKGNETSYSIINTNWDIYSLVPMIIAHETINHENGNYFYDDDNKTLYQHRIYSSWSNICGTTYREGNNQKHEYPYHIVTEDDSRFGKLKWQMRPLIVKTYFPHGLTNMYACPYCKKTFLYLHYSGDNLIENYEYSKMEGELECPHCKNKLDANTNRLMLMQTTFKHLSTFVKSIEEDMLVEMSKCSTITFVGYSLPFDDPDYLIKLKVATNANKGVLKRINVLDYDADWKENEFKPYDSLPIYLKEKEVVQRYCKVFSKDLLYFNFVGSETFFKEF